MNESLNILAEFEVLLRELINKAHRGDEQAIHNLDIVKQWLNNN